MTNKTQTLYKSYIIEEYFATKKQAEKSLKNGTGRRY